VSYTNTLKIKQMPIYELGGSPSPYEEDHPSRSSSAAPRVIRRTSGPNRTQAKKSDPLETKLKRQVCKRQITLAVKCCAHRNPTSGRSSDRDQTPTEPGEENMSRPRVLAVALIVNGVLAIAALGWIAWIATSPRCWFADAYAAQGPQGEKGPRGDDGPAGPAGPVGPDAADAISSLESDLSDLTDRVDTLESDLSTLQDEAGTSTLEDDVQQVSQTIGDVCDALLSSESFALQDIYSAAC
jgi:hypothetical protein